MGPSDNLYNYIEKLKKMGAKVSNIDNDNFKDSWIFDIDFESN